MSDRSPLFIHAVELLNHAMELFRQSDERKYPFIVMHLAECVELLLQDRLIDAGQSLYEGAKSSPLPISKVLDLLKKEHVKIPERPFIDFLFEDRTTMYHRFERQELKTIYRYIDEVTAFAKRFLRDEYGVALADILLELGQSEQDVQIFGVLEGQGNVLAFLDELFALSPESATLQAFNFVEEKFVDLSFLQASYFDPRVKKAFLHTSQRSAEFEQLLEQLVTDKFFTRSLVKRIATLRSARNYAVYHNASVQDNAPDWEDALEIAKALIVGLNSAIESQYDAEADEKFHEQ
jgi:hypothetical protein